jgi:hypothetical protein
MATAAIFAILTGMARIRQRNSGMGRLRLALAGCLQAITVLPK